MSSILPLTIEIDSHIQVYACEFVGAGNWVEAQLQKKLNSNPDKKVFLRMSERKDPIARWALQEFQQKYQADLDILSVESELLWAKAQVLQALNLKPELSEFSQKEKEEQILENEIQILDKQDKLLQRFVELFTRSEWLWRRALAQAISESAWYRLKEPRLQAMLKIQSMDFGRRKGSAAMGLEVNPSLQWYAKTDSATHSKKIFFMGINPKTNLIFEFEGEPWMAELIDFIEDHRHEDIAIKADDRITQAQSLGLLI